MNLEDSRMYFIYKNIDCKKNINMLLWNLENREEKENERHLSKKETKVKEHLEEMAEITRHLGYNDIDLLNRNYKEKQKEEIKKDIEQNIGKERQD